MQNTFIPGFIPALAAIVIGGCAPYTLPPPESADTESHAIARVSYNCADAPRRTVRYPDNRTAIVPYKGRDHRLTLAISADGARYTGDDIEWWTRGSGTGAPATLFVHRGDGKTGATIARCHEVSSSRTSSY